MDTYERWIEAMREQGANKNPNTPQLGVIMKSGKIMVDNLPLEKGDYLLDCNLRLDDKEKVYYHTQKTSSGEYVTDGGHNGTLKEYKNNILREGDRVLVLKLEKSEKFVVLAKVVETI